MAERTPSLVVIRDKRPPEQRPSVTVVMGEHLPSDIPQIARIGNIIRGVMPTDQQKRIVIQPEDATMNFQRGRRITVLGMQGHPPSAAYEKSGNLYDTVRSSASTDHYKDETMTRADAVAAAWERYKEENGYWEGAEYTQSLYAELDRVYADHPGQMLVVPERFASKYTVKADKRVGEYDELRWRASVGNHDLDLFTNVMFATHQSERSRDKLMASDMASMLRGGAGAGVPLVGEGHFANVDDLRDHGYTVHPVFLNAEGDTFYSSPYQHSVYSRKDHPIETNESREMRDAFMTADEKTLEYARFVVGTIMHSAGASARTTSDGKGPSEQDIRKRVWEYTGGWSVENARHFLDRAAGPLALPSSEGEVESVGVKAAIKEVFRQNLGDAEKADNAQMGEWMQHAGEEPTQQRESIHIQAANNPSQTDVLFEQEPEPDVRTPKPNVTLPISKNGHDYDITK